MAVTDDLAQSQSEAEMPDMENPLFSRPRNPELPTTELQVAAVPKRLVDMLDAVSLARGQKFRGPLVVEILESWAKQRAHEWMVMERVVGGNPAMRELAGFAATDDIEVR